MENLKLESLGMEEMDEQQICEINGGWAWLVPAIFFQITMEVIDGSFFEDVKKGHDQVYN